MRDYTGSLLVERNRADRIDPEVYERKIETRQVGVTGFGACVIVVHAESELIRGRRVKSIVVRDLEKLHKQFSVSDLIGTDTIWRVRLRIINVVSDRELAPVIRQPV